MHRATVVYVVMIAACALGLWAVLSLGGTLVAPEDLAGKWTLTAKLPADSRMPLAPFGPGMTVDQSGRFFQIAFDNGPQLELQLEEQTEKPIPDGEVMRVALVGEPWHLTAQGAPGGDDWLIRLIGPNHSQSGLWNARRITRTFPHDTKTTAGSGGH